MKIVSASGTWFKNNAQFVFVDPENGTRFEPGVSTKAEPTDWAMKQPCLEQIADPLAPAPVKTEAKKA